MAEPVRPEEEHGPKIPGYRELILAIDRNPRNPEVWEEALKLARDEEGTGRSSVGFYGHVPLEEMIAVAERLREAGTSEEKYKILAGSSSTGELWYDIVLGHTNDQSLKVMDEEIGYWKNRGGERVGKRKWKRGLDIGSGTGNSLAEIKKHAEKVVGVDRLGFLLKAARLRPELSEPSETSAVVAEALNLPFSGEKFDLAITNGLTLYLSDEQLKRFIKEVGRILEPGGSYFEAFILKDKGAVLPYVEREFLESGKGVLACLMDRMITHREEETPGQPSAFSLTKSSFEAQGFSSRIGLHKDKGVAVLEFKKRFPREIEGIKKNYLSGEIVAWTHYLAHDLLYLPQKTIQDTMEPPKLRTPEEVIKVLDYFGKLADDQEIIEAGSWGPYYSVFMKPLLEISINGEVGREVQNKARELLSANLDRIYQRKVKSFNVNHISTKTFLRRLGEIRSQVQDKPGFEDITAQIETISSKLR